MFDLNTFKNGTKQIVYVNTQLGNYSTNENILKPIKVYEIINVQLPKTKKDCYIINYIEKDGVERKVNNYDRIVLNWYPSYEEAKTAMIKILADLKISALNDIEKLKTKISVCDESIKSL